MKKVYETSTSLEAYMVKNLLENEGVESRVDGEHLQGGVGELQAIGIVRVMVDEANIEKAINIITLWESEQSPSSDEKPKKSSSATNGFIFGVIFTIGLVYLIFNSPVTSTGIDYNGDGFLNQKWIYENDRISITKIDRNFDKSYDLIINYGNKKLLEYASSDDDFDGFFETTITYLNDNILYEESDTDQNGVIDYRVKYESGIIQTIEYLDESNGNVKKRQIFKKKKMISSEYDSNGDGILNIYSEYDQYEEKI